MTVKIESGYTLPNSKFPRILHKGNQYPIRVITASDEETNYPASVVDNGDTVDRWRPFANDVDSPSDFSASDWTATRVTVGADGQTITETAVGSTHFIEQAFTFTAVEHVVSARVKLVRGGRYQFRIQANDGTVTRYQSYDLSVPSLTSSQSVSNGNIVDLGNDEFLLTVYFSPNAGTGHIRFYTMDDGGLTSYTGDDTVPAVQLLEYVTHKSQATLELQTYDNKEADCFAVAAHNLGSRAGRIQFEYKSTSRTNLLPWSEGMAANWSANNTPTGTDGQPALDGNKTATQVSTSVASSGYYETATISGAVDVTGSIFVKYVSGDPEIRITLEGGTTFPGGSFGIRMNCQTGEFVANINTPDGYSITDFGDGWFRVTVTKAASATGTAFFVVYSQTSSAQTWLMWAGQMEEAAAATPYIPTFGSSASSEWYRIDGWLLPTDDSPIMLLFTALDQEEWRVVVDRGPLPEIGVVRLGSALQMQRPFYGGATVGAMDRNTVVTGNISGSGQLLGRSKKRTTLNTEYPFQNLTYAWVRDNLDGPNGLIQAMETEPIFAAWRPSETQDVDYIMRGEAQPPQAQGVRNLWSFSFSGEAHSYE